MENKNNALEYCENMLHHFNKEENLERLKLFFIYFDANGKRGLKGEDVRFVLNISSEEMTELFNDLIENEFLSINKTTGNITIEDKIYI